MALVTVRFINELRCMGLGLGHPRHELTINIPRALMTVAALFALRETAKETSAPHAFLNALDTK